jgi:hypothetical protein
MFFPNPRYLEDAAVKPPLSEGKSLSRSFKTGSSTIFAIPHPTMKQPVT